MENSEKSKRKRWSKEETLGLLECYLECKEEFEHPRKKRFAYSNVLEDMIAKEITNSNTTTLCLENKMRTLLNAYKASKDNNNRTGATPCSAPFMNEMDDIFGDRPIIANSHTLNAGCRPIAGMEEVEEEESLPSSSTPTTSARSLTPLKNKRCSLREKYLNEKLNLKKEALKAKESFRIDSMKKMQDILKEKWQNELENEKKKINLLEMLLNRHSN